MDLLSTESIPQAGFDAALPASPQECLYLPGRLSSEQRTRMMALLCFVDPLPSDSLLAQRLTLRDWQKLLRWLDYSGLALYFFDRVNELGLQDQLPDTVHARLHRNLVDNTARTNGMMAESLGIQHEFQDARLIYANLKGFSLVPRSVPRAELRSQFDLDFLVAEESSACAQKILEQRGYRLYGASERSLEFKRNERPGLSLKDLYKDLNSWRVELHIEPRERRWPSPLDAVEWMDLTGVPIPVLSPVDALVGQALHVGKHFCGEFSRAAHLLEFRRHVVSRGQDPAFWDAVYRLGKDDRRIRVGLGLVTLLIEHVMGEFAPLALKGWTVPTLPDRVALWAAMYGRHAVLGSFPGSKLYLLLERALREAGVPVKQRSRSALFPACLPGPIVLPPPQERMSTRLLRYRTQAGFVLNRLMFHFVEGLRYLLELQRWRLARERQQH